MILFIIDSNETPTLDGFSVGFFKNYWHVIKKDLFNCILDFFMNGKLLNKINHTFIPLVQKIATPSQTTY